MHAVFPSFRSARACLRVAAFCGAAFGSVASALASPVYLVGAQVYAAGEDGANNQGPFEYSTNASTAHYNLLVTDSHGNGAGSAISFALDEGNNAFTFAFQSASLRTPIVGLNLFFSSVATSYNPAFQTGVGVPGNLTVFSVAGFSGFGTPTPGTNVASYSNDGLSTNDTSYSGASSYLLGNESILVSQFSATSAPSGTFTLTVRPTATPPAAGAVPEPASLALLGVGLVGFGVSRRRRRSA